MKGIEIDNFFDLRGAGQILGVTRQRVGQLIKSGQLAPVKHIGKKYIIPAETIDAFIRSRADITDRRFKS